MGVYFSADFADNPRIQPTWASTISPLAYSPLPGKMVVFLVETGDKMQKERQQIEAVGIRVHGSNLHDTCFDRFPSAPGPPGLISATDEPSTYQSTVMSIPVRGIRVQWESVHDRRNVPNRSFM